MTNFLAFRCNFFALNAMAPKRFKEQQMSLGNNMKYSDLTAGKYFFGEIST